MSTDVVAARRKAWRDELFQRWVEAKQGAAESNDPADHRAAADAYLAFMRSHLSEDERSKIELENEVARLRAENAALRRRPAEDIEARASV